MWGEVVVCGARFSAARVFFARPKCRFKYAQRRFSEVVQERRWVGAGVCVKSKRVAAWSPRIGE